MPILYIHIGMPKTGTTALQSFLNNNRKLLAKHAGIYYPVIGGNPLRGGTHEGLFPMDPMVWTKLREEIDVFPECDVVLSEEKLWGKSPSSLDHINFTTIQQIFPEYRIKFILYLRRLDDSIKSSFNQTTKHGTEKNESYAKKIQKTKKPSYISERIAAASELVGKENLLLRLYEKRVLKDGDIISDFFDLLGRSIPEGAQPPTLNNPSLPPQALPFLSSSFLPLASDSSLREEIVELLQKAYTFPKGSGVGDDLLEEFEAEIDRIDAYLPGYKNLFSERKLSFSFPEVDVKDPQCLFLCALIYKLLIEQQRGQPYHDNFKSKMRRYLLRHCPRLCNIARAVRGIMQKRF